MSAEGVAKMFREARAARFDVKPGIPHETYGGLVSLDGVWSSD